MKTKSRLTPAKKKKINKRINALNQEGIKEVISNKNPSGNGEISKELRLLVSMSRAALAGRLGKSYGEDRKLYKALGWKEALIFEDYNARYQRDGIGKRIVDAPVSASWRLRPEIEEKVERKEGVEKIETEFEKRWKELVDSKSIYHYLVRADKLSGIGQYGILLLGFDDANNANMKTPVESAKELMWMRAYSETNAVIKSFVADPSDERYGLPEFYEVSIQQPSQNIGSIATEKLSTETKVVHWTRVLHIAEELLEDDINGTPRMECVFNWLYCLEMVSGSSAEIWWRVAIPGLAFILDKDAQFDSTQTMAALQDEVENYIHGKQRTMRLQGMDIKNLSSPVADPSNLVKVYISLIAGSTGIPQRILIGSERGELSSSQDETAWNKKTDERRKNYCEPMILRKLIERLGMIGVLTIPDAGYNVNWEDIIVPTDEEKAKVRKTNSEALAIYANSIAASDILSPELFFSEIMEWDDETIKKISGLIATEAIKQEKQAKEDERIKKEDDEIAFERQKEIEGIGEGEK